MCAGGIHYELKREFVVILKLQELGDCDNKYAFWRKIPPSDERELLPETKYSAIKKWLRIIKNG